MKEPTCHNCGCLTDSSYCPQCGQRSGDARLSFRELWDGLMSTILGDGFDGESGATQRFGLLGTLWQMLRHPVRTVTAYLAGQRRRYFNPITLLFLVSALCAIVNSLFGVSYFPALPSSDDPAVMQLGAYITTGFDYINAHPAMYVLLELPLSALVYKWIFRPRKLRYIEFFFIGIFTSIISLLTLTITGPFTTDLNEYAKMAVNSLPVFCVEVAIFRRIFGHSMLRTTCNLLLVMLITAVILTVIVTIIFFTLGILYVLSTTA